MRKDEKYLLSFYENASFFMDSILAHKIRYMLGPSFSAQESFNFCKWVDEETTEKLGLASPERFGNYTEQQLSFALKCIQSISKDFDSKHKAFERVLWYEAHDFLLNIILETGKYKLHDQLQILMDDWYAEELAKRKMHCWR